MSVSIKYRKHARHTLAGVAGVSRLGCTHTRTILSTGMLMHSHTEDLAEAARVQAVCTHTRHVYKHSLRQAPCMDRGRGSTCRDVQGWKAV